MARNQCFVDFGSSQTKAIISDGSHFQALLWSPLVADLPPANLQVVQATGRQLGSGLEALNYIQFDKDGPAYALGEDAEGLPNKSTKTLDKSELAALRALGIIGEMFLKFNLSPTAELDLGYSLPFAEYGSGHERITSEVQQKGQRFWYRGKELSPTFRQIKGIPEAAGLVLWKKMELMHQGQEGNRSFVVVMIGHRDLSFLLFRNGKPPSGEPSSSRDLGLQQFLTALAQDLPCEPDDPFLYQAVIQKADRIAFPKNPNTVFDLRERRPAAQRYYWSQVEHFLSERFAAGLPSRYEVLVGGGTVEQIRPELQNFLDERSQFCQVDWLEDLRQEVGKTLNGSVHSEIDQLRLADVYGAAKWLAVMYRNANVARI